jgi:hypothetical protein
MVMKRRENGYVHPQAGRLGATDQPSQYLFLIDLGDHHTIGSKRPPQFVFSSFASILTIQHCDPSRLGDDDSLLSHSVACRHGSTVVLMDHLLDFLGTKTGWRICCCDPRQI